MIATERLDLREFTIASATAVVSGAPADPAWAPGFPREDDADAAGAWLGDPQAEYGSWFITVRDTGLVVGTIGFFGPPSADGEVMVGYGLVESARLHGYATEALRALVAYAMARPEVRRVVADPDLDNAASHNVLVKAGFTPAHATDTSQWFALTR